MCIIGVKISAQDIEKIESMPFGCGNEHNSWNFNVYRKYVAEHAEEEEKKRHFWNNFPKLFHDPDFMNLLICIF